MQKQWKFSHQKLEVPETLRDYKQNTTEYGRTYEFGVRKYPSVTTVLAERKKDFFREWRKNNREKAAFAPRRGTAVHGGIERFLNNEPIETIFSEIDGQHQFILNQFYSVLPKHVSNICFIERAIYSDIMKVAGTIDLVADWDNEPAIIDFKTSGRVKPEEWVQGYLMQATAYSIAFKEHFGGDYRKIVVLIANDTGSVQVFEKKKIAPYAKLLSEEIQYFNEKRGLVLNE